MAKWHYEAKWSILNGVSTISENSHIVRVTMACCDHGCTEFHLGNIGLRSRFGNFIVPQSWRYAKPEEHQSFREMERAIETENCSREADGTGLEQAPPRMLYSNPDESLAANKATPTAPRIGSSGHRESPVGGSPGKGGHCATLGDAG